MAERPSNVDESFRKFLDDLKKQNNQNIATQLLNVKYNKEIATEDDDKREGQLDKLIDSSKRIEQAVTGININVDVDSIVEPLTGLNDTLTKQLEELSLVRKLSEGSLEYDKQSAQYRNTSGREQESKVSGKRIAKGGYVDFETASDRLKGQSNRVRQQAEEKLINVPKTNLGKNIVSVYKETSSKEKQKQNEFKLSKVEIKPDDRTWKEFGKDLMSLFGYKGGGKEIYNATKGRYAEEFKKAGKGTLREGMLNYEERLKKEREDDQTEMFGFEPKHKTQDNIQETQAETEKSKTLKPIPAMVNPEADNIESPAEIQAKTSKDDLELTRKSKDLLEQQLFELKAIREALGAQPPTGKGQTSKPQSDLAAKSTDEKEGIGLPNIDIDLPGRRGPRTRTPGRISGGLSRLAGSTGAKVLGSAAAVGLGAYTAYQGYTGAEEERQQEIEAIDAKVKTGEVTPAQAQELKNEIAARATENKGGAIGEGTGLAAGAIGGGIAGAKVGATIGTFLGGPVGTAIGAGVGTLAGGAIGAISGSSVGKNIGGVIGKGIAGIKGFFGMEDTAGKNADMTTKSSSESSNIQVSEETFRKNDLENYKKYTEYINKRTEELVQENTKKYGKEQPTEGIKAISREQAKKEAGIKFKREIEAAGAGSVEIKTTDGTAAPGATIEGQKQSDIAPTEEKGLFSKAVDSVKSIGSSIAGVFGFNGRSTPTETSNITPSAIEGKNPIAFKESLKATNVGGIPVVEGVPLTEKQMALIEMKKSMGNKLSPEIEAKYESQKQSSIAPALPSTTGPVVAQTSKENQAMRDSGTATPPSNVVVNNVQGGGSSQNFVPMKSNPRPSESSLSRYQDRVAAY